MSCVELNYSNQIRINAPIAYSESQAHGLAREFGQLDFGSLHQQAGQIIPTMFGTRHNRTLSAQQVDGNAASWGIDAQIYSPSGTMNGWVTTTLFDSPASSEMHPPGRSGWGAHPKNAVAKPEVSGKTDPFA